MPCDARDPETPVAICSLEPGHTGWHYDDRLDLIWSPLCRAREPLSSTHFCSLGIDHDGDHVDHEGDATWPQKPESPLQTKMRAEVTPSVTFVDCRPTSTHTFAHAHCCVCEKKKSMLIEFEEPPSFGPFLCEPNRMWVCEDCLLLGLKTIKEGEMEQHFCFRCGQVIERGELLIEMVSGVPQRIHKLCLPR